MRCVVQDCDHDTKVSKPHSTSTSIKLLLSEPSQRIAWRALQAAQAVSGENGADEPGICTCHFLPDEVYIIDKQPTLRVGFLKNGMQLFHCMMKPCDVPLKRLQYSDIPIVDGPADSRFVEACRICLATDGKLYRTPDYDCLERAYNTLTGLTIEKEKYLPPYLCQECAEQLLNAVQFRCKALQTRLILGDVARKHNITRETVKYIRDKFLKYNIGTSQPFPDDYEMPFSYTNNIDPSEVLRVKSETNKHTNDAISEINNDEEINNDGSNSAPSGVKAENNNHNDMNSDVAVSDNMSIDNEDIKSVFKDHEKRMITRKRKKITFGNIHTSKNKRSKTEQEKGVKRNGERRLKALDLTIISERPLTMDEQIAEVRARQHSEEYKTAPYKCLVCFKWYKVKKVYESHVLKHDVASGEFECDICKIRHTSLDQLRFHIGIVHRKEYKCKMCKFQSRYRNAAVQHQNAHKGIVYQCQHCPLSFRIPTTFKNHVRNKHPSRHGCPHCGYMFVSELGLQVHTKMKHKNAEPIVDGPFCETCDLRFANQVAFDRHMKLSSRHNSGDDPKRLPNDPQRVDPSQRRPRGRAPGRTKAAGAVARAHNTQPKMSGPVQCEQCEEVLKNNRAYAQHFKLVHPSAVRTRFPTDDVCMCELCGHVYGNQKLLMCHMWNDHRAAAEWAALPAPLRTAHRPPKAYDCPQCGRRFINKYNFNRHVYNHTGQRPFQCTGCPKGFKSRAERSAHFEHVHEGKPWPKRIRPKRNRGKTSGASETGETREGALTDKIRGVKKKKLQTKRKIMNIDNNQLKVEPGSIVYITEEGIEGGKIKAYRAKELMLIEDESILEEKESFGGVKRNDSIHEEPLGEIKKNDSFYEVPLEDKDEMVEDFEMDEEYLEEGEGDLIFYDELGEENEISDGEYNEEVVLLTEDDSSRDCTQDEETIVYEERLEEKEEERERVASVTDDEKYEDVIYYDDEQSIEEPCDSEIIWEDEDTWREPDHD